MICYNEIEHIKKPLTYFINLSMLKGVFPEQLKVAKVILLYKKGDSFLCINYHHHASISCYKN